MSRKFPLITLNYSQHQGEAQLCLWTFQTLSGELEELHKTVVQMMESTFYSKIGNP